jgi:hypothetical protein
VQSSNEFSNIGRLERIDTPGAEDWQDAIQRDTVQRTRALSHIDAGGPPPIGGLGERRSTIRLLLERHHAASSPSTQRLRASASVFVLKLPA